MTAGRGAAPGAARLSNRTIASITFVARVRMRSPKRIRHARVSAAAQCATIAINPIEAPSEWPAKPSAQGANVRQA